MAFTASLAAYTVYPMLFRRTPMVSKKTLSSSTSNTVFIALAAYKKLVDHIAKIATDAA
jgi:hypothetical protein